MADNSFKDCQSKYHQVLKVLLDDNYSASDDSYLEKIIGWLFEKEYKELFNGSETLKWLDEITLKWEGEEGGPNSKVAVFTLKLISLLAKDEWQFVGLRDKNILERIESGMRKHCQLQIPSIKLSYIVLLQSIAQHTIGLHWIKQSKSWKKCIEFYENNQTIYMLRESSTFLYDVITKFSDLLHDNNEQCIEIVERILDPLKTLIWSNTEQVVTVDDTKLQQKLTPMLSIVCNILTKCIESRKRSRMAYYILVRCRLEYNLWKLADITYDHIFLGVILRLYVVANFTRLSSMDIPPDDDLKTVDLSYNVFAINFFNYMSFCLARRSCKNIISLAELNHVLWKALGDQAPQEIIFENQNIKISDQALLLQLFPIVYVIKSRLKFNPECIEELCTRFFDRSCEHTTRLLYSLRDTLQANTEFDSVCELAAKSIQGLLSLKTVLHRDRAILAFQTLIFTLKEYVPNGTCSDTPPPQYSCVADTELLLQTPNLMSAILNGLKDLIKNYSITWKDCIESTMLVNLMLALLKNPNLSSRLTVQSLKLTQISIEHFLAPNLALLMDTLHGSGIEHLGPMILKRLHDNCWETRDTALELLTSVVEISEMKFPAFQKHIIDSGLCPVVENLARHDSEPYVRASALKCLKSMTQIKMYWACSLNSMDLVKFYISSLGTESEGVVRREAVCCITAVYSFQKIETLDAVFSALAHAAVNDLYWEVKLNALNFWQMVISQQLKHQGMIDDTFPTVTFSKEHKKIVTLTNKEIILRLQKVLNELSLRGCLGVILACLQDDSDLEVVKLTVAIVQKLMKHLTKYNYIEEYRKSKNGLHDSASKIPVVDTNYSDFTKKINHIELASQTRNNADFNGTIEVCCPSISKKTSEQIIDSIINLDDMGLLAHKYQNNLNLKEEENERIKAKDIGRIDEDLFKKFAQVSGEDFLHFITEMVDLDHLVLKKTEWMMQSESFSSLLDDILMSFNCSNDANDVDCY